MAGQKTGRPRSEQAREAVLAATREMLGESGTSMTIEGIARRAGVGKPTIYRWWPSMADIVLEALLARAGVDIPVPDCPSAGEALRQFLRRSMEAINSGGGVHLRFLMAQAQQDDGFRERFRANFVEQRRSVVRGILERCAEQGLCVPGVAPDLLVDVIYGAMWYRLLVGHAPTDTCFADDLVALVLARESSGA